MTDDEKLIQQYFDGELSANAAKAVEERLLVDGSELSKEIQGLQLVRSETKAWMHAQIEASGGESIDVWSAVAREIQQPQVSIFTKLKELIARSREGMFIPVAGLSVAALALLIVAPFVDDRGGTTGNSVFKLLFKRSLL